MIQPPPSIFHFKKIKFFGRYHSVFCRVDVCSCEISSLCQCQLQSKGSSEPLLTCAQVVTEWVGGWEPTLGGDCPQLDRVRCLYLTTCSGQQEIPGLHGFPLLALQQPVTGVPKNRDLAQLHMNIENLSVAKSLSCAQGFSGANTSPGLSH